MRFVNYFPRKTANCVVKAVKISDRPHVGLYALKHITVGMELRYDYGGGDLTWRRIKDIPTRKLITKLAPNMMDEVKHVILDET